MKLTVRFNHIKAFIDLKEFRSRDETAVSRGCPSKHEYLATASEEIFHSIRVVRERGYSPFTPPVLGPRRLSGGRGRSVVSFMEMPHAF